MSLAWNDGRRWRRAFAYAVAMMMAFGFWIVPAQPAAAAFSAPTAVGVGAPGDARVWEAIATTAGSLIRARNYRVGLPGANVDAQRWQWERVASSTTAGITFRIRNVASSRCLDRTSAGLVINDCSTANSQRWRAPLDNPYGGWTLVNVGNSQCLATLNDPNSGASMTTAVCNGSALQRWKLRPAPHDCTVRSSDWTMTEVCTIQSSGRMRGLFTNWHHYPLSMAWLDPELYVLSNTVRNYTQLRPLKPDGSQGSTGVEFGLRADRSVQPTGSVSYGAYWMEWDANSGTEQYHELSPVQAPLSHTADERNHTFMLLGNGDAGQWDLLYDYNTVATTALQAGGSTRLSRSGTAIRYPRAVTASQPFGYRTQLLDGNQVWRLPYLSDIGLAEPKKCDTPPRYEDWIYDVVNLPPNCITSSYKAVAGATSTDPPVLDSFGVGKPGTAAATAAGPPPSSAPAAAIHNGVDQRTLADCLMSGSTDCLDRVPGLADCVSARLVCNINNLNNQPSRSETTPMTAEQALREAGRTFRTVGDVSDALVATKRAAATPQIKGIPRDELVHVVTSSARVHSLAASNTNTYDGYVAVFDAASQRLLYACLGVGCQGQR
ncbi:hypothetical protein CA850_26360 [Micromonospora echinospora]|uniref:Ricin-type beta-trefoil lectin domain-like n=1 Tax=Micromonospora echinospora TaxID=1877 RepID=A0A1C4VLC3_MICEC|nr:RICIN domain-containing protein [Micromonospora echinospora]OZV76742.1 hypothetical protein CA850_26360 [Micromonospora echinospora]SCE84740.1 Ricin-type beta-trefoil lectin domain-like [Micromonospora echinospora]